VRVLTEREMRQRDRRARDDGEPRLYCVDIDGSPDGQRTRWPDLMLERDGRPYRAIEIEFTQKTDARLQRIIEGYFYGSIPEVLFLTADPHLAGKIMKMAAAPYALEGMRPVRWAPRIAVAPWPGADAETKAHVRASIEAVSRGS
jgi:hypothetical protein